MLDTRAQQGRMFLFIGIAMALVQGNVPSHSPPPPPFLLCMPFLHHVLFIFSLFYSCTGGYLRRQPPGTEKRTALTVRSKFFDSCSTYSVLLILLLGNGINYSGNASDWLGTKSNHVVCRIVTLLIWCV